MMAAVLFIATKFSVSRFWIVVLGVFLFSVPIFICGIYSSTVNKISRLTRFSNQGLLFRIFSGRSFSVIVWAFWSLFSSFFMLIQFHTYDSLQWAVFFFTIPIFWLIFILSKRFLAQELKPYLVINTALKWSRWLAPVFMLLVYFSVNFFSEPQQYLSIIDAIDDKKCAVADMTGSNLVFEFSQSLAFYDGIKAYALSSVGTRESIWYLFVLSIGGLIVFFNASAMLSCLLIPRIEYLRLFTPVTVCDKPAPIATSRIATISAVTTFISLFIYLPVFATIESAVQSNGINKFRQATESFITVNLEKIDNAYFKSGTLEQLSNARSKALSDLRDLDGSLVNLDDQIDAAFDNLHSNVDFYLDWYYSLAGEYARIGNLLIGELENYMEEKLEESLQQEDSFREVQETISQVIARHDAVRQEYQETAQNIIEENKVDAEYFLVDVEGSMSFESALTPPSHKDIIDLKDRLVLSAGGGAVAGVITATVGKKIVAKVVGKAVIKTASKALLKVVISKTAGSAGGAAAGAAVGAAAGSIVPGVGTTIGGIVGGILGAIGVGVAVDAAILELDEEMNREEFKNEILKSIEEARTEFKSELGFDLNRGDT